MEDDEFVPGGDLNGEVNPYTGARIVNLDARTWGAASATELYKQLAVLENRFYIAQTLGKIEITNQLQHAISQLKASIQDAIKRDSKRPIRKRPNSYEQSRPNGHQRQTFD